MAGRPDSRRTTTGRHPDLPATYPLAAVARDRLAREARQMRHLITAKFQPTDPGTRNYVNLDDAVADLGLEAERTRVARRYIGDLVKDARDILGITARAKDDGFDDHLIRELIRRANKLRLRERMAKASAEVTIEPDPSEEEPEPTVVVPRVARSQRSTRTKNEYGHRDGLVPGTTLQAKAAHGGATVRVLDGGCFEYGDATYTTPTALLHALHGCSTHKTTMRRYFRLGGERSNTALASELQTLVKGVPLTVTVGRKGLTLEAGPGFHLPARWARLTRGEALELIEHLRRPHGHQ